MNIYRFTIPIPNIYYNVDLNDNVQDGVIFYKHIYFVGERCPYHEEVIARLKLLQEEDEQICEMDGIPLCELDGMLVGSEYKDCLGSIAKIKDGGKLPWVPDNMYETNTHVVFGDTDKFNDNWYPLTVTNIRLQEDWKLV